MLLPYMWIHCSCLFMPSLALTQLRLIVHANNGSLLHSKYFDWLNQFQLSIKENVFW